MLHRVEITATVVDDWPSIKLIVHAPNGVRTETKMHDIAATAFEPYLRDAINAAVRDVVKRHKP